MSFSKKVKTQSGTFECAFIQSHSVSGVKYYVNVVDAHFRAHLLTMERIKGRWKIMDTFKVPGLILSTEPLLEQAILEHQQTAFMEAHHRVIFHIEDDPEDRELLEEAIKRVDPKITVRQAASGRTALSLLQDFKRLHELPCLIVLDMNMPGINGSEVLREIKKDEQLAHLPLVIFTTASKKTYKDLIEKEQVELLTKPSSPSELVDSVRKMLSYC